MVKADGRCRLILDGQVELTALKDNRLRVRIDGTFAREPTQKIIAEVIEWLADTAPK